MTIGRISGCGSKKIELLKKWTYVFCALLILIVVSTGCRKKPEALFRIKNIYVTPGNYLTIMNYSENAESFFWDFGDGFTSNDENPIHSFAQEGTYKIKLIASTRDGKYKDELARDVYVVSFFISPTSQDILHTGKTFEIKINPECCLYEEFQIDLFKDGVFKNILISDDNKYKCKSTFDWNLSDLYESGNNYKLKFTYRLDPEIEFYSDVFTISDTNYITITYPVSSSVLSAGFQIDILWEHILDDYQYLDIDLYKDGIFVSDIYRLSSSNNHYRWKISEAYSGSSYQIKITGDSLYDYSDYFTIENNYFISVYNPTGLVQIYPGESVIAQWNSNLPLNSNIHIVLIEDGVEIINIPSYISSSNKYSFSSNNFSENKDYKVKVYYTGNPEIYGISDSFSVEYKKAFHFLSPDSQTVWVRGQYNTTTWESEIAGNINIYLYRGTSFVSSTTNTTNDGNHEFYVSSASPTVSNYRIKIISASNSLLYQYSDYFSVTDIVVTSPDSQTVWTKGAYNTIIWESDISGNMNLILYKDTLQITSVLNTPNDGSHSMFIPDSIESGNDYRIKCSGSSVPENFNYSNYFAID